MSKTTEGSYTPAVLTDQEAGGLLIAFLAAVLVVLALATMPPIQFDSTSTHAPMGNGQSADDR